MVNPMVLVYERYITSCDLDFHSLQGKENILSIKINQGLCVGRFSRYPLLNHLFRRDPLLVLLHGRFERLALEVFCKP